MSGISPSGRDVASPKSRRFLPGHETYILESSSAELRAIVLQYQVKKGISLVPRNRRTMLDVVGSCVTKSNVSTLSTGCDTYHIILPKLTLRMTVV